jgi:ribosomal protein S27AE
MRDFAEYNDFALLGAMLKRLFNETRVSTYKEPAWKQPLELLDCFGIAFRGDEVGYIGNDILTPLLADSNVEMRATAINVVERWLEYDEDGFWFDTLVTHAEREENVPLLARCNKLIDLYEDEEEEEELMTEMMKDCPECSEGHVLAQDGCWYCDNCGTGWGHDPLLVLDDDDEEEEEVKLPSELQEFYDIRRDLPNRTRGIVETGRLPSFLHALTGIDEIVVIDLLESMKIRELTVRESNFVFYLSNLNVGAGMIMRCWDPKGSFTFSFEPTASEDRWLVFARF